MKVVHSWLTEYLGEQAPDATTVADLLTKHAFEIEEIETVGNETVIDVDVLPNRGADCLSHRGVAREIATLMGASLANDPLAEKPGMPETDQLKISIADPEACRHFDLALITGVQIGESPQWLKDRLAAIGQRSINNVVDATNYVMFGLGQPTHVYDADKFEKDGDQWHFGVKMAKTGQAVTVLGGETYEVDETVQLIVNEADDAVAGVAGVKGGAYAELTADTHTVIVEAGNFNPAITRKAAQKLKLQTDASKRFENGISTDVVPYAIGEVVRLILDLAGGQLEGCAHARPVTIENAPVSVTLSQINSLLGVSLSASVVEDIFSRAGFLVTKSSDEVWKVTAPFERTDIAIAEDVIEEVGRIYGYDQVASVVPEAVALSEYNKRHYYSEVIRDVLTAAGYSEVITSSFCKKDELQLQNALASDKSCLRSSLHKNITTTLNKNIHFADLLGVREVRVFEIGTVFSKGKSGVVESIQLAFGARLKPSGYTGKEDAVITETVALLEEKLGVSLVTTVEKGVAEIDLSDALQKLNDVDHYEPAAAAQEVAYEPFSTYPSMSRDIALWVEADTTVTDVEAVLNQEAGELRVRTTLFDEFTKDGRTSYAFRLVFQSDKKTLTDEEVNSIMDQVYAAVSERSWEVR